MLRMWYFILIWVVVPLYSFVKFYGALNLKFVHFTAIKNKQVYKKVIV